MNHRFPHTGSKRGVTLIEVLAGLVILSTLLVSVAIARGRFLRQWADADQRLTAVHEADRLLNQWLQGPPQAVPATAQGVMDDSPHHPWGTQIVPSSAARTLGTIVVRLQVYQHSTTEVPLARVEFLLPDPRLKAPASTGGAK